MISFSVVDENLAFQFAKVFEEAFEELDTMIDVIDATTFSNAMHAELRITQILFKVSDSGSKASRTTY